ncbi:DMT family transporter [Arenibacterium sp. LLYu02]|uniref:DMT family transporter n=1 Tax=Arenibacterium sp. LLYu02 TaxID=3404132 RepID=UPI003B215759
MDQVMAKNDTRLGILFMIGATLVFAAQDGISRHLASEYNVFMVITIRYWFFAAFVMGVAMKQVGSLRKAAQTSQRGLQIFRAFVLVAEVCVMVASFTVLGLVESHAVFVCYPLLVAALSGPILGEAVGWRRWAAIGMGFVGVLIILQPGSGVFQLAALIPLLAASMFALYGLLTRYVARKDSSATSFFYTGVWGMIFVTPLGLYMWEPMTASDWGWMGALCVTGALGHWFLIKCYEMAEASAVQPFAYLQLPFVSVVGLAVFGEEMRTNVVIGAVLVVAAGLFTFWREYLKRSAR